MTLRAPTRAAFLKVAGGHKRDQIEFHVIRINLLCSRDRPTTAQQSTCIHVQTPQFGKTYTDFTRMGAIDRSDLQMSAGESKAAGSGYHWIEAYEASA